MQRSTIEKIISKYLPEQSVEFCTELIIRHKVKLKITRSRSSRYGDYTPPQNGSGHIITVNHNLNKYFFLLTFIHEMAHLVCHEKYSRRISPHGVEWKNEFIRLLEPLSAQKFFPPDLVHAIHRYMNNPSASSCSDINLMRALKKHDEEKGSNVFHLEDLPQDSVFRFREEKSSIEYRKGEKMRKRFKCIEIKSQALYFVSPVAEVELLELPESSQKKAVQLLVFDIV
jgi:SprT protein